MVEITQADIVERLRELSTSEEAPFGFHAPITEAADTIERLQATIAALEQPTPEMRKAVALAIEQTRSTIERDIKDKNQQQCAAHALADAALAAAAKHLKEPTQ